MLHLCQPYHLFVPPIAPQNEGDPTQSPAIVPASGNTTSLMNKHIQKKEEQAIATLLEDAEDSVSELSSNSADNHPLYKDDGYLLSNVEGNLYAGLPSIAMMPPIIIPQAFEMEFELTVRTNIQEDVA